jgi:Na+/H+ antiporter NhaC
VSRPPSPAWRVARVVLPLALVLFLPLLIPTGDERYLFEQSARVMIDSTLAWAARQPEFKDVESLPVLMIEKARVMRPADQPAPFRLAIEDRFTHFQEEHAKGVDWLSTPAHPPLLSIVFYPGPGRVRSIATWWPPPGAGEARRLERIQPHYQRWALLPPLVAIVLALTTGRALLSLGIGAFLGAMLVGIQESAMVPQPASATSFLNPIAGAYRFVVDYLWRRSIGDHFRLEIVGFVSALMAAVGVIIRGGGMAGMVDVVVRRARTVVHTRLAAVVMGILVFFDDYISCIVVGNTMRPLTDRRRISSEKLSFIVDSTAAPVAGIALLSTWIAFMISNYAPQLKAVGVTVDPYEIFLRAMPYRFYCLFLLFFLFASTLLRRDFGAMLAAERRAGTTGKVIRDGGTPLVGSKAIGMEEKPGVERRSLYGFLPLVVLIVVTIGQMIRIGLSHVEGPVDLTLLSDLRRTLAATESAKALFHGSLAAWIAASLLMLGGRILSLREVLGASLRAASGVTIALAILFLAWAISGVTSDLGTAHVLVALFQNAMPPALLPTLLFLIACAISFATGTSWGTMAILLPNTVVLAYTLGAHFSGGQLGLAILAIAAVFEGAIFGDHASPVSDTTILASLSTGADLMDHVHTQMPYALLIMLVSLGAYVPVSMFGVHPAVVLLLGALVIVGFLLWRGRDPDVGRIAAPEP